MNNKPRNDMGLTNLGKVRLRKPGGGRPPGTRNKLAVRLGASLAELARGHTELAINTIVGICSDPKATDNARLIAAFGLLDRGWGKPKETVDVNVHGSIDRFSDARLIDLIEGEGGEHSLAPEGSSPELN
jgi:hypothetical protein